MKAKDSIKRFYNQNNKAAEKWNEETVLAKLNELEAHADKNKDNYMLGKALVDVGLYIEWFSYIVKKYKDNYDIVSRMAKIQAQYEYRIVNRTLSGEAKSAAMAIFLLKNNYGYKDKTETEIITTDKPVAISFDDDAEVIEDKDIKSLGIKEEKEGLNEQ